MRSIAKLTLLAFVLAAPLSGASTGALAEDKPLRITFVTHDLGAGHFRPGASRDGGRMRQDPRGVRVPGPGDIRSGRSKSR